MMIIAEENRCTGCKACVNICPQNCICMIKDELDGFYAVKNTGKCINCGLCEKVCPEISSVKLLNSKKCYAGFALDSSLRLKCASGGISSSLYIDTIKSGGYICGAVMKSYSRAVMICTNQMGNIEKTQNSKYVYSEMGRIYNTVAELLKSNKSISFIGLPCQVAALKKFLEIKKIENKNLITADLICHGTAPEEYLKQHIDKIVASKKRDGIESRFRDPEFGTQNFIFSIRQNDHILYKKAVKRNDYYQLGYHRGINYRSNCYACQYAKPQRVGDLTFGDFSGVGTKIPLSYEFDKVSCILVNTEKGETALKRLVNDGLIFLEERPMEEAIEVESQLKHPTIISHERKRFIQFYKKTKNYEKSMKMTVGNIAIKNELAHYLHIEGIKSFILMLMPKSLKNIMKRLLLKNAQNR